MRLHFTLNGESQKTEGGKENTTAFIFSDACPIFVKPLLFFITPCWLTCCLSYRVIQNCLWVIVTAPLRSIYSRVCCRWFGGSRSVWVRWCLQSADKVISGVEGYSAAFCHHEDYCTFQMYLHLLQIEPRLLTPCSSGRKKKVRKLSKGWNSSSHILCFVCRCILFISLSFSHDRDWRNEWKF